jgi:hypothetical protein
MPEDEMSHGISDIVRLFMAFDAVRSIAGNLWIYARDEPRAPDALRRWATTHELEVSEHRLLSKAGSCLLSVQTSATPYKSIDIYLEAPS